MKDTSKATTVAGGAILGALITGVYAFLFAFNGDVHPEARAIALIAAAVAFVGVANAIFRH